MAWTETCKIDFVKQFEQKKEQGVGVRKALKILSKESGIPATTLDRWLWPRKSKKKSKSAVENDGTQTPDNNEDIEIEEDYEEALPYCL